MLRRVQGHFWTIVPHFVRGRARTAVEAQPWTAQGKDLGWGPIPLSGSLFEHPGATRCAIVVHGLGGSAQSVYGREMTTLLVNRGWSVLRLNLRGADAAGLDLYHAALVDDLQAAIASKKLAHYTHIGIVGFSLGGHIALRQAMLEEDPRVRGVCAISAPLDLADCANSLDGPAFNVYRRHLLVGLKAQFARCPPDRRAMLGDRGHARTVAKLDSIRGWDSEVIVPRFGFGRVQDYYATASAGPRLQQIRVPALYLGAHADPMIPEARCHAFLGAAKQSVDARWAKRGGHVAFPRKVDFGLGPKPGLEAQVESWLNARCSE